MKKKNKDSLDNCEEKYDFMEVAASLAKENVVSGLGGPFGAVIVSNNKIIGCGQNKVTLNNDPTAHAEIVAIRAACVNLGTFKLKNCVIFSSCEPCPMCFSAIHWARIETIYFAKSRWDAEKIGFDDAELYDEVRKSSDQRKMTMIHLPNKVATAAFSEWENKVDKICY